MSHAITLFTGQWTDVPLEELAAKTAAWGFDGLVCWGDHFEVDRALAEPGYVTEKRWLLEWHGLQCWTLGVHLVGQAVCDRIDAQHQNTLPSKVWGDGHLTGSPVWHLLYSFPPNDFDEIEHAYEEVAERFDPILDVFEQEGVHFALRCIRPRSRTTS
jgi:hypothetical protein